MQDDIEQAGLNAIAEMHLRMIVSAGKIMHFADVPGIRHMFEQPGSLCHQHAAIGPEKRETRVIKSFRYRFNLIIDRTCFNPAKPLTGFVPGFGRPLIGAGGQQTASEKRQYQPMNTHPDFPFWFLCNA